ncbi:hypothetical protein GV827_11330 [Sulfitobacter sp. JBTF-M27]|uniref:Uncharacterized protein n=1 Tax=Sulfitobacter sediminilitoris TaxID=2698830 RepID=A0A6P0CEY9_9RHOB|nr:hypothetical protein [Sulfitobacter sediminilitoris]NEK22994.1 hypothetical protein [Sulfitobacter sediminilitoris]
MATTFEVIYLGTAADIDKVEGNFIAENSGALSGLTFGSEADPLRNHIQQFAPGTGGFSGTNPAGYDHNISNHENFTIDGGADQQFERRVTPTSRPRPPTIPTRLRLRPNRSSPSRWAARSSSTVTKAMVWPVTTMPPLSPARPMAP